MGEETTNVGGQEVPKDMIATDADLFLDDTTKPESAWFKFENVGDSVQGVLKDRFEKEGNYGMQTIYVVEKADGMEVNVALKNTTHAVQIRQLKSADLGDLVAFKFAKVVDTGKGNPAKSIEVRIRHLSK